MYLRLPIPFSISREKWWKLYLTWQFELATWGVWEVAKNYSNNSSRFLVENYSSCKPRWYFKINLHSMLQSHFVVNIFIQVLSKIYCGDFNTMGISVISNKNSTRNIQSIIRFKMIDEEIYLAVVVVVSTEMFTLVNICIG